MPDATIVQVITQLELGGAQEMTLIFCRYLVARGYRVVLVSGRGGLLDAEAERIPGLQLRFEERLVREVSPGDDLAAWRSLTRWLRSLRRESRLPMIVHTHSSKAGVLGRWAAWAAGAEVRVHSIHGFGFNPWQSGWVRRSFELAERLTGPITSGFCPASEANLAVARKLGLLRGNKPTLVLREGIEAEAYEPSPEEGPDVRRELGLTPATPLVGMIACLKEQKSPVDFVQVAARVRNRHPDAHFFVAGDGELRPRMEAEIAELRLADRFHLLGWRRDVRSLLGAADVLVLTSLWEGLPRVVLQTMAAGKPMIATRVDGTPEAVSDGTTGFLLEPHDLDGFAERIHRLLARPQDARRMGESARARVEEFRVGPMLARLEQFYGDLLSRAVGAR